VIIGSLMLLVSPLIGVILSEQGPAFPNNYALLFGIAGLMFALSTVPCIFIQELPGAKAVQKAPPFREFLPALGRLLRDDGPFRAYIAVRIGTNLFLMAAPFYIGYATVELGLSSEVAVPTLLAMQTAGSLTGALVYTWLGERNNLLYIRLALGAAALLPISALLAGVVGPLPLYIGFLVSGLANSSNLFASFLNWVVGYAHADQRPLYVGLSNTITALVSLVAPVIGGTIAQQFGYRPLFVLSLVMALSTLFITVRFLRAKPQERAVVMTAGTS
jgi:MFS family permease